ncbi:unnamed protein product [Parnassius apollo]|uniref:(apollo) hypothetical protein n=1 Tax=Parnassius apollo TaxID=110799 RepID=A0A8S3YBU0_PARAO|nr:unnamed protein product [Parnassius apollo]
MPIRKKKTKRTKKAKLKDDSRNKYDIRKKAISGKTISDTQKPNVIKCVKGGLKRLHSPLNRIATLHSKNNGKGDPTTTKNPYHSTGLSPKETSYLISCYQNRSSRYLKLKDLAAEAKRQNKIFTIYGTCGSIRKALLQRGWVEKIPPNRMTLTNIFNGTICSKSEIHCELEKLLLSNLVQKCNPNFVWRENHEHYETTIDMKNECNAIINKLKSDALWTSKQGLCNSMKINYWFYIEDVAEVNCPRTYDCCNTFEIEEFISDYKITACTSLIKLVLSQLANKRSIFVENGTLSLSVIKFALNRCKEYILRKQNKDIDRTIKTVSTGKWNTFLKKYYRLVTQEEFFEVDKHNKLPLYISYTQFLLQEIYKYRPQAKCEGYHNIWIIKPAYCSRGRGIRMASKLGVIRSLLNKTNNYTYVVQKYIGEDKVWDNIIYPGMKKSIIGIMLSCQDTMPICKNRFELYGCDFLLDEEYTPWLIEINSCPDLNRTTEVTAKVCPAVVDDIVKVVIDYMADPNASTGQFECIYRQAMTVPRFSSASDLIVKGISLTNDYFYKGNAEITQLPGSAYLSDENENLEAQLTKMI